MATKPIVMPDSYSGEKSWDEWIIHFNNCAQVNGWDDAAKLMFLKVRLTGQAQSVFQRLPEATKGSITNATKALSERFEPTSKRELYLTQLSTKRKQPTESWANFAEDLRKIAIKAYPSLAADAVEQLALTHFLQNIHDVQVSFAVKQKAPKTLDDAVSATIQMESYLITSRLATVGLEEPSHDKTNDLAVHATSWKNNDGKLLSMMEKLVSRMDNIEATISTPQRPARSYVSSRRPQQQRGPLICHKCGQKGHFARGCAMPRQPSSVAAGKLATLRPRGHTHEGKENTMAHKITNLPISPVNSTAAYHIHATIFSHPCSFLLDTGATVTLINAPIWKQCAPPAVHLTPWTQNRLIGVNGSPLHSLGATTIDITIRGSHFTASIIVVDGLTADAILGLDFLKKYNCTIDIGQKSLFLNNGELTVHLMGSDEDASATTPIHAVLHETIVLPAKSEAELSTKIDHPIYSTPLVLVENALLNKSRALVARAVASPVDQNLIVRVINPTPDPVTLHRGTKIATLEHLQDTDIMVSTITSNDHRAMPYDNVSPTKRKLLWDTAQEAQDLTENERDELYMLFLAYEDIFASHSNDFGRTGAIKHPINTQNTPPIRQQPRRIPPHQRGEASQLIDNMLQQDVIQRSSSPWASPIVLVKKKDGSLRFCVDYRKLNGITRKDAYPLPRVDDTLDTLAGSKWFTTLDLISGYWQVELEPEHREKTAFCTQDGLFEFKVMPFGLCNAPATFQRLMDMVLLGLQWTSCLVYLDDVIILGKNFHDHLGNLQQVFERFRQAGLKMKPGKCKIFQKKVPFLGHIVSESGIATDPMKTEQVANWPVPTTRRQVQQFLGLANYYRRFIQGFAQIAKPLHRLTEKNTPFKWTSECQDAFETLRCKLVTAPVLSFPDCSKTFILDTDASDVGIGAVLSQVQDNGEEHVIAYGSRILSKAERRYSVTRKELLAIVIFVGHFRQYLLGKPFVLRTDHNALKWLKNFRNPEGQLARWLEKLEEYSFSVEHRPGKKHANADSLIVQIG